jgi:hypothetical protein
MSDATDDGGRPSLDELHHELDELGEEIEEVRHRVAEHHPHGPTFAEGEDADHEDA